MKKAVSFVFAVMLILSLVACNDSDVMPTSTPTTTAPVDDGLVTVYLPIRCDRLDGVGEDIDYTYDEHGRIIEERRSTESSVYYSTLSYTYNEHGHVIEKKDFHLRNSRTILTNYDYTYSDTGLITGYTATTDGVSQTYSFSYDPSGNLTHFKVKNGPSSTVLAELSYSDNGKVGEITIFNDDEDNDVISIKYDHLDRIVGIRPSVSADDVISGSIPTQVLVEYDSYGRISQLGGWSGHTLTYTDEGVLQSIKNAQLKNVVVLDENGCVSRVVGGSGTYIYQAFKLSKEDAERTRYLFDYPYLPILRIENIINSFIPYPQFIYE